MVDKMETKSKRWLDELTTRRFELWIAVISTAVKVAVIVFAILGAARGYWPNHDSNSLRCPQSK